MSDTGKPEKLKLKIGWFSCSAAIRASYCTTLEAIKRHYSSDDSPSERIYFTQGIGMMVAPGLCKLENNPKYQQSVLIIDDEEELCLLLTYALRKLGFRTEYSLSVKDGNKKLMEFKPDIVLLDINLPDGSGLYMIPKIKQRTSAFLVISAYDDKKEIALAQGAADFIKKPFNLGRITNSIINISTNGDS